MTDGLVSITDDLHDFASLMVEEILAKLRAEIDAGGWTIDRQREVLKAVTAEQDVKRRLRDEITALRKPVAAHQVDRISIAKAIRAADPTIKHSLAVADAVIAAIGARA